LLLVMLAPPLAVGAAGCAGPFSALDPAGRDAERIARLFAWMAGGALLVWVLVVALAVYALRARRQHSQRTAGALIVGGGVMLPTVAPTGLLSWGLWERPGVLALPPPGGLRIAVTGEQWLWRVRYEPPDGPAVELANEIRLPVGQRIALRLESPDVIHSFWLPALAGKIDMVPGRVNHLALEPTRTGTFRGACAEYCGTAHAWMRFDAVVMEPEAFAAWLARQQQPAAAPEGPLAARGGTTFLASGCGACHTVRGTPADGVVGPDLTHVGSRLRLAAGVLPNEPAAFERWIARPHELKPDVHMPA